jgi:5-bromo-4-chloroindolyl phosphate hydrolysis protein
MRDFGTISKLNERWPIWKIKYTEEQMKTLVLFVLLMNIECNDVTTVYVCDSKSATRYHYKSNCRGLRSCSYRIVKIRLEEAKKQGKTLCGWEK